MKFVLAIHGSRGDVEPCAAVGLELARRGHEVAFACPPNLVGLVESTGLATVAYGPDSRKQINDDLVRNPWRVQSPIRLVRAFKDYVTEGWSEMSNTVQSLADGADLVLTGTIYEGVAANVAEFYDIPLAVLHYFPSRSNSQLISVLPGPLVRSSISTVAWLHWRMTKEADDAQRSSLGLPKTSGPLSRRNSERGSLEIQAYDELCFPGLAAEWGGRYPFVGAMTMELSADDDDEILSWIRSGSAPICFGFGSMPVRSPADTVTMISAACAELGERALICSGWADFGGIPHPSHVKIVRAVNHAAILPICRAIVHHGGAGTTAAGLRAGIPTLILWITSDQPVWAAQVKRLGVGFGRRFAATTQKSLVADLRSILAPQFATRAREVATWMTKPAVSVGAAADLLEEKAGHKSRGEMAHRPSGHDDQSKRT